MKSHVLSFLTILILLPSFFFVADAQDDVRIWREFIDALKKSKITPDNIRPYEQLGDKYKPILLGYLDSVRTQASPRDWAAQPEIIRTENRIQYITPWTARGREVDYCFSFITEDAKWYFQHLEAIFIRLDTVNTFPTSTFPDVSEQKKNWAREELYWSYIILNFYLPLANGAGKDVALNMLKDGAGYYVGARTWVPFTAPHKAFILYLCWEQANLRANEVTLEKITDNEAIVRLNTHFFALYFTAAHLKPKISIEDYKNIFETIWQDRALNAGWSLEILYSNDYLATLHFTRNN